MPKNMYGPHTKAVYSVSIYSNEDLEKNNWMALERCNKAANKGKFTVKNIISIAKRKLP